MALFLAIALPVSWISWVVFSYVHKNAQLLQRNNQLEQEATQILERLETLETEIRYLQERAGLTEEEADTEEPDNSAENIDDDEQASQPEGGESADLAPELLLDVADSQLPLLAGLLQGRVKPALEKTLVREEARPRGIPIHGYPAITSNFGLRQNPFGRGYEFHKGIDFRGDYGTPIHVTAPGSVEFAGWEPGFGYHVIVDHGYGYRSLYGHLSKIEAIQGTEIGRDRVIGYLGSTGRSSGPHLHYSVYRNGEAVDPEDYLN